MIGYNEEKKGYKLYDPEKKSIQTSRDVVFDETIVLNHVPLYDDDDKEYEIQAIIGERVGKNGPEFLVKWAGYDESHDTWEPLEHVKDTTALDVWESRDREVAYLTDVIDATDDPKTYKEAMDAPDAEQWRKAIDEELASIDKNNT